MLQSELERRRRRIIRERRRKRRIFFLKLLFFIIELVVIFVLLRFSSVFDVQEISIEGNYETTKNNLIKLSGIKIGENLFALDSKEVKKNLLSEPLLRDAKIKKEYVDKVSIVVEERVPVARFNYNGKYYYTDNELNILTKKPTKKDTLLMEGFLKNAPTGEKLFPNEHSKDPEYLFIEKFLNEYDLKDIDKVSKIEDNIDIFLKNGAIIHFGNTLDYSYKMDLLTELMNDVKEKKLDMEIVDMTKGKYPIVILKEEVPNEE